MGRRTELRPGIVQSPGFESPLRKFLNLSSLGFLVCKMGQRCPLTKFGVRLNEAVDVKELSICCFLYLHRFTICPSRHVPVPAWLAPSHHAGLS